MSDWALERMQGEVPDVKVVSCAGCRQLLVYPLDFQKCRKFGVAEYRGRIKDRPYCLPCGRAIDSGFRLEPDGMAETVSQGRVA